MKQRQRAGLLALCCVLGVAAVTVASASPSAAKQRIAIDAKSSIVTSKLTFVLATPAAGELGSDVGHGESVGSPKPPVLRKNGQTITPIVFVDTAASKKGTFEVHAKVDHASAGNSWGSDHGTWTFKGLTGVYAGYSGGGGVALVVTPAGKVIYRLEGYVSQG
jgi:hypothetical protein